MLESKFGRAWRDTENFRQSAKSFWIFEVVGAAMFGIIGAASGFWLTPQGANPFQQNLYPAIGGGIGIIVGFIIVFALVFVWNLFCAPYRQLNETRLALSTLQMKLNGKKEPSDTELVATFIKTLAQDLRSKETSNKALGPTLKILFPPYGRILMGPLSMEKGTLRFRVVAEITMANLNADTISVLLEINGGKTHPIRIPWGLTGAFSDVTHLQEIHIGQRGLVYVRGVAQIGTQQWASEKVPILT
jgi:hypothetical protein